MPQWNWFRKKIEIDCQIKWAWTVLFGIHLQIVLQMTDWKVHCPVLLLLLLLWKHRWKFIYNIEKKWPFVVNQSKLSMIISFLLLLSFWFFFAFHKLNPINQLFAKLFLFQLKSLIQSIYDSFFFRFIATCCL